MVAFNRKTERTQIKGGETVKTGAKTKVNWDLIDAEVGAAYPEIPANGITSKMLMERYGITHSPANEKLRKLCESGKFELVKVRNPKNGKVMNMAIPVE